MSDRDYRPPFDRSRTFEREHPEYDPHERERFGRRSEWSSRDRFEPYESERGASERGDRLAHDRSERVSFNDRDYAPRDRYTGSQVERTERDYPARGYGNLDKERERGDFARRERLGGHWSGFRQPEYGNLDRDGNYVGERSRYADRSAQWDDRMHVDDRFRPGFAGNINDPAYYGFDEGRAVFAGRGPRGYKRSDERIREEVCDALMRDPMIDASDIDVRVEGGHVTLEGSVDERRNKRRAEDMSEAVAGVQDVTNHLR